MKYLIANWKSNKTYAEATQWFEEFETLLSTRHFVNEGVVVLAVPFPFIALASEWIHKWNTQFSQDDTQPVTMQLAVQDISQFPAGSYTGAVCTRNLADFNVAFAIVGHLERRRYLHETAMDVAGKVDQALEAGITPIVCVDDPYLDEQAQTIQKEHTSKIIVAYEALKTIGTGNNLSVSDFESAAQQITEAFGKVPVLYGGSVKSDNVTEYEAVADGYLVGGASLVPADFMAILDRVFGGNA